jgi:hypothetical protein
MSYDIFFVRRDPGQSFEDALDDLEGSYEGGDPGLLTDDDLELWAAVEPAAREILGPGAQMTQDDEQTRELTDTDTGIGLTFFQGEFEIHVPGAAVAGDARAALMTVIYDLARAVEQATGLEGYDPQRAEPVSGAGGVEGDDSEDDVSQDDVSEDDGGPRAEQGQGRRWWGIGRS